MSSANAVPEGCVLSVSRNDNEMKHNAEVGAFYEAINFGIKKAGNDFPKKSL